jgi:hypothetical protein
MSVQHTVYLCLTCFEVSESGREHHGRRMTPCDVGAPGDERRKPQMDGSGRLTSHAPRWYLEVARHTPGGLDPRV